MGRKRKNEDRILGPYHDKKSGQWKMCLRGPGKPDDWSYYRTERQARRTKLVMETELTAPEPKNISEAIEEYRTHLKATGRQNSTYHEAGWRLHPMTRIVGEDRLIDNLKRRHVEARLKAVSSVAGRKGTLGRIRHFCRWAISQGYLDKDPTDGLRVDGVVKRGKPRLTRTEARILDEHLWKTMQAGSDTEKEKALASLLLLYLGMREGELLALQVRDCDLESQPAVIQVERHAKTFKGLRDFEVPGHLAEALKRHIAGRTLTDWVWPSKLSNTGHRGKNWILDAVKTVCRSLGITETGPQGLRGTQSRLATEAGATAHLVAQQLGHESTDVTIRSYIGEDAVQREQGRQALKVLKGGRAT